MTGRGRPRKGTKVQVRIPPEVLDIIDQRAAESGVSRAELVRRVLSAWAGT